MILILIKFKLSIFVCFLTTRRFNAQRKISEKNTGGCEYKVKGSSDLAGVLKILWVSNARNVSEVKNFLLYSLLILLLLFWSIITFFLHLWGIQFYF